MLRHATTCGSAAFTVVLLPMFSAAQQPNLNATATAAIQRYNLKKLGTAIPRLSVHTVVAAPCRRGDACSTDLYLAVFYEGDGAGEALLRRSRRNPKSFDVLISGGGSLGGPAQLEALGVSPSQARRLLGP